MHSCRTLSLLVLCLASTTGCHRYNTVLDHQTVIGTRGRLTLSPEGRGNNAQRLGGVAVDITGTVVAVPGDSIGIKADVVHFADLGTVPFAQGELHFAMRDVSNVAKEVLNRKKSVMAGVLTVFGALLAAEALTPTTSILGFKTGGQRTAK